LIQKRKNTNTFFKIEKSLFSKLNNLINSTERRIFFIIAPYHSSYLTSHKNTLVANNFLLKLNKHDNVTIIDLRNFIEADSLFLNTAHLNYKGAITFSKKINELLTTNLIYDTGYGEFLNPSSSKEH